MLHAENSIVWGEDHDPIKLPPIAREFFQELQALPRTRAHPHVGHHNVVCWEYRRTKGDAILLWRCALGDLCGFPLLYQLLAREFFQELQALPRKRAYPC